VFAAPSDGVCTAARLGRPGTVELSQRLTIVPGFKLVLPGWKGTVAMDDRPLRASGGFEVLCSIHASALLNRQLSSLVTSAMAVTLALGEGRSQFIGAQDEALEPGACDAPELSRRLLLAPDVSHTLLYPCFEDRTVTINSPPPNPRRCRLLSLSRNSLRIRIGAVAFRGFYAILFVPRLAQASQLNTVYFPHQFQRVRWKRICLPNYFHQYEALPW
jgi:hypothetical protein